jgi:hypothetical protein
MIQKIFGDFEKQENHHHWYWYVPFAVLMTLLFWQILRSEDHTGIFSGITLGIHEAGHLLLCFREGILCSSAGTLFQILAPLTALILFLRQKEFFGIPFSLLWLSSSLFETAIYISDARAQLLPLVSVGGGDVTHDWFEIQNRLGLLNYDIIIGKFVSFIAFVIGLTSLVLCFYMIYKIKKKQTPYSRSVLPDS